MKRLLICGLLAFNACDCGDPPVDPAAVLGDGFAGVTPIDATTVLVLFAEDIDAGSVGGAFAVQNFTTVPPRVLDVDASATGAREVTLKMDADLVAGTRYTVVVDGVRTASGRSLRGTLNFTIAGVASAVDVVVEVGDVEIARRHSGLSLFATVAPDGRFSEELVEYPLVDDGSRFVAHLNVGVDPARTLDSADDGDATVDRRAFVVLVMDDAGALASALVPFVVDDADVGVVFVDVLPPISIVDPPDVDPLPAPPTDDNVGDGLKQVRIVVDDRASQELVSPQLKTAFGADGSFDANFPQTLTLTPMTGDDAGYWEVVVGLRVDAARVVDGSTPETFPYIAFLVEEGAPYEALSTSMVAPDETPQTVRLTLGNPEWTPVTFRVDASKAYLNPAGSERGVRAGEAVFLTGEWGQAVDALGNNCGDGFSGGEGLCLRMKELDDKPGVWTRTIWLPPGRPYGWKTVRCDADDGCRPLNELVSSSGRAFATVMKNLATDNVDAFADAAVGIVDVVHPEAVVTGAGALDYSDATVFVGAGNGGEEDPAGTPDGQRMFKQEVPDLIVVVAATPVKTRVIHVGTWRDVNLGTTPQQIIEDSASVDLGLSDYDDGFTGRFPPSREEP